MSEWYEVAFDRLYPVLYRHRDDAEATRAARTFAPLVAAARGPVLDLACGAGRHMGAFAASGLAVVGMDLSAFLLERAARDDSLHGGLVRSDMRELPFRSRALGGVINMFTSFGYFESDDENRQVLSEVARVLRPGGRFLMDFLNTARIDADSLRRTERTCERYTIVEDRSLSADRRTLVKRVSVTHPVEETVEYTERVRMFDPEEMAAMMNDTGLRPIDRFGDYDGGPFERERSDRLITLCETEGGR